MQIKSMHFYIFFLTLYFLKKHTAAYVNAFINFWIIFVLSGSLKCSIVPNKAKYDTMKRNEMSVFSKKLFFMHIKGPEFGMDPNIQSSVYFLYF